jgi:hypothetical protein
MRRFACVARITVAVAALAASGCGDSDNNNPTPDLSMGGAADLTMNPGADLSGQMMQDAAPPAPIIVAERVFMPNGRSYYVSVLTEMPTSPIDRTKAREFTSADIEIYDGKIYLRDRPSNLMTLFSVSSDLQLVQEAQLSFQNTGLPSGRAFSAYLSPTLAFILDGAGLQMIGWDPTNMKLTGDVISLAFLKKDMLPTVSLGQPTRSDDRVIIPVSWDDSNNLLTNPGIGAMLILDANMKAPPTVVEDPRVGGGYVAWDFNGDAYVGGTVGGDVNLFGGVPGGGKAPSSGVVRLKKGTNTFDQSFVVDVNAATGTIGAWGVHMLDPTHLLCQILDPAVDPKTIMTPDDFYNSTSFFYILLDTSTMKWTKQAAIATGGIGNAQEHVVDGVEYVGVTTMDGADVYPATAASGLGAKQFSIPSGDLWFAQRLR